jgi:hypothetical protein
MELYLSVPVSKMNPVGMRQNRCRQNCRASPMDFISRLTELSVSARRSGPGASHKSGVKIAGIQADQLKPQPITAGRWIDRAHSGSDPSGYLPDNRKITKDVEEKKRFLL